MHRLRYWLRLIRAFLSRFKVIIIIGICLGISLFLILSFIAPRLSGWSETRVGIAGRYSVDQLPDNILRQISSGLTQLDASGSVLPDMASSWSTTDNGKTWIFKLKHNLTWQDGRSVVSKSILYQFSDATISYPDAQTITFTLQNAYSAFPSVVSRPVFREGLLGTGEWRVKNLELAGSYVDQIILENSAKNRIIYKFYPTEDDAKLAFELGQVDSLTDLLDPGPLNSWPKNKIVKNTNKNEYVAVFFNMNDQAMSDKSLRQALSYGTQKTNLGGERAIGPISSNSWAYNSQVKPYDYDPLKAKTMIAALTNAEKNNLNITLTTSPLLLPQAELIQKDWEAVGVKTTLQVVSNVPTNFQALLAIFDTPSDPDQYSIWHSTQVQTNITHYSNPRIDKLLEDGRTTINPQERKQIYLDFQRFLVEDSPAIFLYYPTTYTISR